jgi:hypothetical protein
MKNGVYNILKARFIDDDAVKNWRFIVFLILGYCHDHTQRFEQKYLQLLI